MIVLCGTELDTCASLAAELAAVALEQVAGQQVAAVDRGHKAHPGDVVTRFDVEIERRCRARLAEVFPRHTVVGEELGTTGDRASGEPVWFLDPIDGTANFARGLAWSSFSLAVADEHGLAAGAVADLHRGSVYAARRGAGAWRGTQRIGCGGNPDLSGSVVLSELAGTTPRPGLADLLEALAKRHCAARILGSSALSLVSVAAGHADAAFLDACDPIDVAAGVLLAREAGALVVAGDAADPLLTAGTDHAELPLRTGLLVAATRGARDELVGLLTSALSRCER